MNLALNIEHFARPVVSETKRVNIVFNLFSLLLGSVKRKLYNDIDNLILAVEGFYSHTDKLDQSRAIALLDSTKRVISKLNKMDENLQSNDYLKDEILKEKFQYMLKSIYKMESILHKAAYKNIPVEKTPTNILDGISKMNNRNMSKIIYN